MKLYLPTGTCYQCDRLIPDGRFHKDAVLPSYRFCSEDCERAYKARYPKRYKAMSEQLAPKAANAEEEK